MKSLRNERQAQGITQVMLEEITGIHQENISLIEHGLQKPNQSTRKRLEDALGPIDWAETTGITVHGTSYTNAEKLVRKLIAMLQTMNDRDRRAIKKLIHKYFK